VAKNLKNLAKDREDFIVNKVYMDIISDESSISDEEINEYYNRNKQEFTENGELKPFSSVKYQIKTKLQKEKLNDWFEKIKKDYNIIVEKK